MKEIIAFLSPRDEIRFEKEVNHPTSVCRTFGEFKAKLESTELNHLVNDCMIVFSQEVSGDHYHELIKLIDGNLHLVFRMLNTEADPDEDREWYDRLSGLEWDYRDRINVVNNVYLIGGITGEFTGRLCLKLFRETYHCRNKKYTIRTLLWKNPDWVAENPETDG